MNVLSHIKEEHEKFKEKMSKIKAAKKDKKKLFREFYAELSGHHEAEEHVVFPLVRKNVKGEDDEIVLEMIEEHSLGSYQFSVLEKTPVDNETWNAKFSVLKEVLEHHMKEEEKDFIPLAREVISEEKLENILEKFESVLKEYKNEKKEKLGL